MTEITDHHLTFEEVAAPPRHPKGHHSAVYTCRLCNGEQKMEVNHKKGLWFCHKEQRGGRLKNGTHAPVATHSSPERSSQGELEDLTHYHRLSSESNDFRMRYVRDERSILTDMCACTGPEFDRVYFPVWHIVDQPPAYFVGRSVFPEHQPPYKHPCQQMMTAVGGKSFWGLHCCRRSRSTREQGPHITLVEGIFDACHAPDRLAVMGSSLTPSQVGILRDLRPASITVMLDGDACQQAADMIALLKTTTVIPPLYLVRLPYDQDPDSLREGTKPYEDKKERIV